MDATTGQQRAGKAFYAGGGKKGARKPPQLLQDMRDVYNDKPVRGQGRNESPGIQSLRALLRKDPEKFAARLWKMEQEQKKVLLQSSAIQGQIDRGQKVEAEAPPAEEDIGEQRAIELLERLLAEEGWKKP